MLCCRKIKDKSNSPYSVRFCNIAVRSGDHAPFLETHGNSVILGRSVGLNVTLAGFGLPDESTLGL